MADIFGDDVDGYVEALRDVTHAKHAAALRVSLAPNAQHWLMPIEEYYLRGFEPRANGSLAVAFVCTEALDGGVRAVAARWDLRAPPATEATTHHASPNKSHGGMLAPLNAEYVFMYVCMYICIYDKNARMCVVTYVCTYVNIYIYICICICICM